MIKIPQPGTYWRYVPDLPGGGETHKVIFSAPQEVITVGEKHCWLGDSETFQKLFEFQPIPKTKK